VYVTHDQAEALAISDRIAVVRDGRVEQVGTPEAVYRQPRTRFVAAFVGENNVFDAEVVATDSTAESIATETTAESIATGTTAESTPRVSLAGETITLSGPDDDSAADREPVTDEVVSGDGVVVCVRPEDIRIGGGDVTVTARVDHVEFLGDAYRVHCAWNDRTLLAKTRTDPRREDAGAGEATVQLGFDASDVTVVTTETGDARPNG
jgi:thiamine transport system ATP-binding protein